MIQDDSTEISGWVLKAFGDCADLVRDSVNPTEEPPDLHYIGLEHIEEGALQLNGHGFAKEVESNKFHFRRGDILFGKLRPYFRKVVIAPFDGICSTDIWVVRAKKGIEQRYLFYWMASQQFIDDTTRASEGTKMPRAKWDFAARLERYIPPLPEQHAIAHVLGTLDDKIELNRKMNATLEAMAQVTFKSWFVDFDPVRAKVEGEEPVGMDAETAALFPDAFEEVDGREVPKGWSMGTVGQIADIIDCLHAKKPERRDSGRPFLQLWNIRDDGLIDMTNTYHILEEDYLKWISRIEASAGDCVITNVGRVGAVSQIPEGLKAALGRNMTAIRCKSDFNYPTFLIELLLSDFMRKEIAAKTDDGTILSALNVRNIPKLKVIIPPIVTVDRFESIARPIRKKMEENLKQSRTLTALRDTLLPKLISGEIRVPDAMLEAAEA